MSIGLTIVDSPPSAHHSMHKETTTRSYWILLLGITAAASFVRFFRLATFPGGLFWDEAYEGLDAYSLFGKPVWEWPVFFTAINGREPLYVYLVHFAQTLWGPTTVSIRVVSAAAGALLVPALAWLGWELAPGLGVARRRRYALWTAAAGLALFWSQTISRLGQRISLFVLLETLLLAALWRAWTSNSRRWWLLTGVLAGVTFSTYLASRALPFALALCLIWALLRHRPALQVRWRNMALAAAAAVVVASPLLVHYVAHPQTFLTRAGQVDILASGGIRGVVQNAGAVLGMAFIQGDLEGRLNYLRRPVLDWLTVVPFLVGLVVVLRRFWRPASFFLLATLGFMLLPSVLSAKAPNFGRASGALPVFALLIGLGLDWLAEQAARRWPRRERAWSASGWALLLASTALTARVYYVDYARLPDLFYLWQKGYAALAGDMLVNARAGSAQVHIYGDVTIARNAAIKYLTKGADPPPHVDSMDGNVCVRVPTDGSPARYYLLSATDSRGEALLSSYLPDSQARTAVVDEKGNAWARVLDQPHGGRVQFPEMTSKAASLEDSIELAGYWVGAQTVKPGDRLYVRLFWRVTGSPRIDYTTFVHLEQTAGSETRLLTGTDAAPGKGACPTTAWRPNEMIVDELQLVVPSDAPAGEYALKLGMYDPATMARLPLTGGTGDDIALTQITVSP